MDWQPYLEELRGQLRINGMKEASVDKYINRFSHYFETLSAADAMAQMEVLGTPQSLAANILEMERMNTRPASESPETPSGESAAPAVSEPQAELEPEPTDMAADSGDTGTFSTAETAIAAGTAGQKNDKAADLPQDNLSAAENADGFLPVSYPSEDTAKNPTVFDAPAGDEIYDIPCTSENEPRSIRQALAEFWPDRPAFLHGDSLFWILFILTLPITLSCVCGVLALLIGVIGALSVSVVLLLAALIGVVIGGTVVSVAGILYGTVEMLRVLPIGLYEMGIGVCIGGAALFIGILMYNTAVRLIPYLIRWLIQQMIRGAVGLRKLFVWCRKECASL